MSDLRSLLRAKRTWFQRPNVFKIHRPRTSVTERDDEKSETLTAPNPGPLPVRLIENISMHQSGNAGPRLLQTIRRVIPRRRMRTCR